MYETFGNLSTLSGPLVEWLDGSFVPTFQNAFGLVGNILAGFLSSGLLVFNTFSEATFPIIEWFVVSGLPMISQFADQAILTFQKLFDFVKHIFDTIWMGVIDPVLKQISKIIVDTLAIIKEKWDKYGATIFEGIRKGIDSTK